MPRRFLRAARAAGTWAAIASARLSAASRTIWMSPTALIPQGHEEGGAWGRESVLDEEAARVRIAVGVGGFPAGGLRAQELFQGLVKRLAFRVGGEVGAGHP